MTSSVGFVVALGLGSFDLKPCRRFSHDVSGDTPRRRDKYVDCERRRLVGYSLLSLPWSTIELELRHVHALPHLLVTVESRMISLQFVQFQSFVLFKIKSSSSETRWCCHLSMKTESNQIVSQEIKKIN